MKLYTKQQLIDAIREIFRQGWHKSVKETRDTRNDGAVGNTIETLLGLKENNLPLPNTQEWELKGQRSHSSSLVTLKHIEPSPTAVKIVSKILLPIYGWKHQSAGIKYPITEMSFRSTTSATEYTLRGFKILVDKKQQKIRFVFDSSKAKVSNPEIRSWIESIKGKAGLGPVVPEPYWGIEDLKYAIGEKIKNCFYVIAESKVEGGWEFFLYKELYILSGFSSEKFIKCIEDGVVLIDFDARTGHNHGTKFRIKQNHWKDLFSDIKRAI
jgi:hypothetical protein